MKTPKIVLKKYEIETLINLSNSDAGKFIKKIIESSNTLISITNTQDKFIPPTIEQVTEYCFLRQNSIDAEVFVSYYNSKGWKIGKSPMKDWKSAIITWEKNRRETQPNTQNSSQTIIGRMNKETLQQNLTFNPERFLL